MAELKRIVATEIKQVGGTNGRDPFWIIKTTDAAYAVFDPKAKDAIEAAGATGIDLEVMPPKTERQNPTLYLPRPAGGQPGWKGGNAGGYRGKSADEMHLEAGKSALRAAMERAIFLGELEFGQVEEATERFRRLLLGGKPGPTPAPQQPQTQSTTEAPAPAKGIGMPTPRQAPPAQPEIDPDTDFAKPLIYELGERETTLARTAATALGWTAERYLVWCNTKVSGLPEAESALHALWGDALKAVKPATRELITRAATARRIGIDARWVGERMGQGPTNLSDCSPQELGVLLAYVEAQSVPAAAGAGRN